MTDSRELFNEGRQRMIRAFVDLTMEAMRAGVGEDVISELHGEFFDGNVGVKAAFAAVVLVREVGIGAPAEDQ